ncbi:sarcosine oxidase subunit gamma [Roseibium sp.]|uniref:sarcosine oxidase subunit gamma n=1 Tax=Roseibium sp. TaxID=1936156 RepID=UPI003A977BDA
MTAIPFDFRPGTLVESAGVSIRILMPKTRLSLRARTAAVPAISRALGVAVPEKIGQRASGEGANAETEILCLGPDEWVLLTDVEQVGTITAAMDAIYKEHPHSLVDVSDREITVEIFGDNATDLLTLGWPRNPLSVPVGEARRTVFDGASVVIWHDSETSWRLNGWRSFMPHLLGLLVTGCRELSAE